MQRINLDEKFGLFAEQWRPKIIAAANGQEVKIVKVQGDFPWHHHDEDELFLCWDGSFRIELADGASVTLSRGDLYVVPRRVEHHPVAEQEAHALMLERPETKQYGSS